MTLGKENQPQWSVGDQLQFMWGGLEVDAPVFTVSSVTDAGVEVAAPPVPGQKNLKMVLTPDQLVDQGAARSEPWVFLALQCPDLVRITGGGGRGPRRLEIAAPGPAHARPVFLLAGSLSGEGVASLSPAQDTQTERSLRGAFRPWGWRWSLEALSNGYGVTVLAGLVGPDAPPEWSPLAIGAALHPALAFARAIRLALWVESELIAQDQRPPVRFNVLPERKG